MTTATQLHTPSTSGRISRTPFQVALATVPDCAPAGLGLVVLMANVGLTFFSQSPDRWFYLALADGLLGLCLGLQIVICRRTRAAPTSVAGPAVLRPMAIAPQNEHACTPHRVADILEQAIHAETRAIGRPEIHVLRDYADLERVCIDAPRTLAVLRPILRNAVEALRARASGPHRMLLVRLSATPFIDGLRMRIEISDNGVGIAPRHLARLFAQGFSTHDDQDGMGLYYAHQAAQHMGATLSVASAGEGLGATVTLEIPTHFPA